MSLAFVRSSFELNFIFKLNFVFQYYLYTMKSCENGITFQINVDSHSNCTDPIIAPTSIGACVCMCAQVDVAGAQKKHVPSNHSNHRIKYIEYFADEIVCQRGVAGLNLLI